MIYMGNDAEIPDLIHPVEEFRRYILSPDLGIIQYVNSYDYGCNDEPSSREHISRPRRSKFLYGAIKVLYLTIEKGRLSTAALKEAPV